MHFVDTHTHLYLNAFDNDRKEVVEGAITNGVEKMLLPNIDSEWVDALMDLHRAFPSNCLPMMGLHPTSVKKDTFEQELANVKDLLEKHDFVAVGEIGIDLYWDTTYKKEQEKAFRYQIELALIHNLPVVIHSRESIDEILDILNDYRNKPISGVFHCFTGNINQAHKIMDLGFFMGIGGVATFKNSNLANVIKSVPLEYLLLETDAPFLAPVPYRGKRNSSEYIPLIARKIAEARGTHLSKVAEATTKNAENLFRLHAF